MNDNRKLMWTKKGLSVGLVLVLLLLTLASAGQAQTRPEATTQGAASAVWRLPFLRTDHTAIFQYLSNGAVQRIIVFGGWNGRQFFNDVWALDMKDPDHAAWTKLNPHSAWPPPRAQHTAIYDEANQRMIVFGGHQAHYNFNDVWALDLSTPGSETWTQLTPGGATIPAMRYHSAVYDAANQRMIVFGGSGRGGLRNDTWALDLSTPGSETWSQLSVTGSVPAARWQHTAIYDSVNDLMVVFGGSDGSALRNDTWALNLTTLHWAEFTPAGDPPPARRKHSAAYYDATGNMYLFGGLGTGGFLDDLWYLRLPPNTVEWLHVTTSGGPPAARAGHTATFSYYAQPMIVLGGRGMGTLAGETQWLYSPAYVSWSQFTPTLPEWWQGGAALKSPQSPQGSERPDVTLQIEDAEPDTTVNVLPNQEVWFVAKIKTTSATYANDVDVTLDVNYTKFDVVQVGARYKDADDVTNWTTPTSLGGGRYRLADVDLEKRGNDSKYQMQVVFKANVKADADPGRTPINVVAEGANWLNALDYNAYASIRQDPNAWIVTNRTQLFEQYDNSEVRRLLDKTFEIAQGGAENNNGPAAVVLYAERYVPALKTWDNTTVSYASEAAANTVADQVASWLVDWVIEWGPPMTYAYPNYLVILGDDNIIPFYRKYDETNGEGAEDFVTNADPVLEALVDHNYYFTDNPYGDRQYGSVRQDWTTGDLESAVGRIVGASAADMEKALQNGVLAPDPESRRVIIASGQDLADWQVPGGQNDVLYPFNLLGYNYNASLVDADPSKTDVTREMAKGFDALLLAGHGTVYGWIAPGGAGPDWPDPPGPDGIDGREMAQYDDNGDVSAGRIFYHFLSCRTGLSHTTQGPYDSMVYALTHHEASAGVASAGLACCVSGEDELSPAEALSNDFWAVAALNENRSDPLGWALKQAKRRFTSAYRPEVGQKTLQTFTYFGLPWMRMPGAPTTALQVASSPQDAQAIWSPPRPAAPLATFVMTTTVDASTYTLTQTVEGFDLIQVEGLGATFAEGEPVLPQAAIELMLPLSATVTSLTFTPTQALALNSLDIPSLQFEAGATAITATYTNTVDGVYPVTATVETHLLDTYQLVRVNVIPVTYDAANDQATLYRNVDVAVEYDTPETIGLTSFEPDEVQVLPGDPISTTTQLLNAGDVAETVTATLVIQDAEGQIVGFQGSGPFDVPAGGTYDLELGWTGPLDGDVYLARMFIWQGGQVVAGAGAGVSVTAGEVSDLTAPEALMPGEEGTFALTFDNLGANTSIALGSLAIYDQEDTLVAFLPAQAAIVAGGGSATLTFQWTPDEGGSYTASFMLSAGGQEYGPLSQSFEAGYRVYLPLTFKNHQ